VVHMLVPPGCITLMPRLVRVFGDVGALDVRNMTVAAMLMNAVSSRLYG
jgi:hypothetical protein